MDVVDRVVSLYPRLIEGDASVLGDFTEKATVDAPLHGRLEPPEFLAEERAWLDRHAARVDDVATVTVPGHVAHELVLRFEADGEEHELPVLLVADVRDDAIRDLRIYHSTWPLNGTHTVRHPLMQYAVTEEPEGFVGVYHRALADGDAAAADAAFTADGSVREPAGSAYTHRGAERTAWYETILADGGIPLQLGVVIDDGTTVVFEFCVDQWGKTLMPPQAGAAVYQRGDDGRIASARIYDDVDPPILA